MMDYAQWRNHRGFIIVEDRTAIFGRRRYSVWRGTELRGLFADSIRAELFIDGSIEAGDPASWISPEQHSP